MTESRPYPEGTVFFYGGNTPEHISEAKSYIAKHGLTRDDVSIIGNEDEIMIISKREATLKG